ncbi:hypothetical protein MRB53_039018 [Persea americana]|nr:hypothetical protein MRB53_039018 [Persea americana]
MTDLLQIHRVNDFVDSSVQHTEYREQESLPSSSRTRTDDQEKDGAAAHTALRPQSYNHANYRYSRPSYYSKHFSINQTEDLHGLIPSQLDQPLQPTHTREHEATRQGSSHRHHKLHARTDFSEVPDLAADEQRLHAVRALEPVRTVSRVPDTEVHYYEKNGIRTYGDGQDHDHDRGITFKRGMVLTAMAFLWTGSLLPLFLFGGVIFEIIDNIGGYDIYIWLVLGNLAAIAIVTPFTGSITDLVGRKNVAIGSSLLLMVGGIVCAVARTMGTFIAGMVISGAAAGAMELTALAVAGEIAPTRKRGIYIGCVVLSLFPFCPGPLYAQLIAQHGSWRGLGGWVSAWGFTGALLTAIFYWPPPRPNSEGLSRMQILKRIDYLGGVLITVGLTLFLYGLVQGGGRTGIGGPSFSSKSVLIPLVIGFCTIIGFLLWESFGAPYPLFPRRLATNPRPFWAILMVTFVSGANFLSAIVLWATQWQFMYSNGTAVQNGVGTLPIGFGFIIGAALVGFLISKFPKYIHFIIIFACCVMVAGNGALAAAKADNYIVFIPVCLAAFGVGMLSQSLGGAVSYAVSITILKRRAIPNIINVVGQAVIHEGVLSPLQFFDIATRHHSCIRIVPGQFEALDTWPKVDYVVKASHYAWQLSYPEVYYVNLAFGLAAVIAACFLPNMQKFMDGHVAVQYH